MSWNNKEEVETIKKRQDIELWCYKHYIWRGGNVSTKLQETEVLRCVASVTTKL